MKSGVVRKKLCRMNYKCIECEYNRKLIKVAKENRTKRAKGLAIHGARKRIVFWKDKLRQRPSWQRPCIYHLMERMEFRACTNNYECITCEFAQFFLDYYPKVYVDVRPIDYFKFEGFSIPQGYYFYPGHTWVRIEEGNYVRVGLDDFALRVLGPMDEIRPPLMGKEVEQGKKDILICRGKDSIRIPSPVTGVVTAMNPRLAEEGSKNIEDPYTDGWMITVRCTELREDLRNLMIGTETHTFMGEEVERLYGLLEEKLGPLAADGGSIAPDLGTALPELEWRILAEAFLARSH